MERLLKVLPVLGLIVFTPGHAQQTIKEFSIGTTSVNVTRIEPVANEFSQCYVSVMVYNSTTLTDPTPGASVTVISRSGNNYTGYAEAITDGEGQACVLVHCYIQGLIFVENGGERLFAAPINTQRNNLPQPFRVDIQSRGEEILFHSFVFGSTNGRSGPVYNSRDYANCRSETRNHYHFTFSYLSVPDQLTATPVPTAMPDIDQNFLANDSSKLIWLYGMDGEARTCYLKIKIKVGNGPVVVNLESRLQDASGTPLGVFVTGPKPDPVNPSDDKLACLMFRCPVRDIFTDDPYSTYIQGNITGVTGCTVKSKKNPNITISKLQFQGTIPYASQLSPIDGLFQHEDPFKARARCFTGNDFLGESSEFEIANDIAFEYDCTFLPSEQTGLIVFTPGHAQQTIKEFSIGTTSVNVTRIEPVANDFSQCYVSVMVYNSTTLTDPTPGASVTVISRSGNNYTGYAEAITDGEGQACVLVHCYIQALIFVENDGERLFAAPINTQRNNLPQAFRVDIQSRGEEILFRSFVFGTTNGRSGPVYNSRDYANCRSETRNHYHFTFSYLSVPDQLAATPVPTAMPVIDENFLTNDSSKLIWLYGMDGEARTCYLKIKIKVGNGPVVVNLESRLQDASGTPLGVFVTGPKPDPVNPSDDKLACLMFRCPVRDIVMDNPYSTYIQGNITGVTGCTVKSKKNPNITISKLQFQGTIPYAGQLSPIDGLFQHEDPLKARARCFTGNDFLGESSEFEIANNIAFEYDCTI